MILLSLLATYLVLNILNILYIVGSNKAFTKENSFVGWMYDKGLMDKTDTFCSVFWYSAYFIVGVFGWISLLTLFVYKLLTIGLITILYGLLLLIVASMLSISLYYILKILKNKVSTSFSEELSEKHPNALLSGFKLWYDSIKNKYCPTIKFK